MRSFRPLLIAHLAYAQSNSWTANLFGGEGEHIEIDNQSESDTDFVGTNVDETIKDLLAKFNDHVLDIQSDDEAAANEADHWTVKGALLNKVQSQPCPETNVVFCESFKQGLVEYVNTLHDNDIALIFPVEYRSIKIERKEELGVISNEVATLTRSTDSSRCQDTGYVGRRKKRSVEGCQAVIPLLSLQYGCWCDGNNDNILAGRGTPVDEFDKVCKAYRNCQRCIKLDAAANTEICDPSYTTYYATTSLGSNSQSIVAQCQDDNAELGNCAIHSCCCNLEFTRALLDLIIAKGAQLNPLYQHHNSFDPMDPNLCPVRDHGEVTRECCGRYPNRKVYNSQTRLCCQESKIFNPIDRVCCDDGSIAPNNAACNDRGQTRKKRK